MFSQKALANKIMMIIIMHGNEQPGIRILSGGVLCTVIEFVVLYKRKILADKQYEISLGKSLINFKPIQVYQEKTPETQGKRSIPLSQHGQPCPLESKI